jgi:predicted nucleic acid-binding protein
VSLEAVPHPFVDTSVFVNVFTAGENDPDEWLPISTAALAAAERGKIRIVVSGLVIAETLGCPNMRGTHIPREQRRDRCNAALAWFRDNDFETVEIARHHGDQASRLAQRHQLRGPDALHLVCAQIAGCDRLWTWDSDLIKVNGQLGALVIEQPYNPDPEALFT